VQQATLAGPRIPAKAQPGLEIVQIPPGPWLKAKHRASTIGALDGITHREQAGQSVSGGLVAQTQRQDESWVHSPRILRKEEVVVPPEVFKGLPTGQRLIDIRHSCEVVNEVLDGHGPCGEIQPSLVGGVPQSAADEREEDTLSVDTPEIKS
jgi:hypothetical protein